MRHRFVRLLGRGVERDGVVGVLRLGERKVRVEPVDGARGGVHQVPGAMVTDALEDVHEAIDVGL